MTTGKLDAELRHLAKRLIESRTADSSTGDHDFDELAALHSITLAIDVMIDQRIISARRRARCGQRRKTRT